jgi:hypothetical protein
MRNLHRIHIQPLNTDPTAMNPHRSKDRQLAIMLLAEIVTYVIFSSATPVYGIYQQITQYYIKSVERTAIETFVLTVVFLLTFVNPATSFYVNMLVSKTFRQKTIELFCKHRQHRLIHVSQSQNPAVSVLAKRATVQ